jgi:hypothetical protein
VNLAEPTPEQLTSSLKPTTWPHYAATGRSGRLRESDPTLTSLTLIASSSYRYRLITPWFWQALGDSLRWSGRRIAVIISFSFAALVGTVVRQEWMRREIVAACGELITDCGEISQGHPRQGTVWFSCAARWSLLGWGRRVFILATTRVRAEVA